MTMERLREMEEESGDAPAPQRAAPAPQRSTIVVETPQPRAVKKPSGPKKSLSAATAKVFGRRSMDNVSDDVTLGSLGLDSLMAVEMKQMLEKDFDIQLSLADIRKMTMERLREMEEEMGDAPAPQRAAPAPQRATIVVETPQPRAVKKPSGPKKSLSAATA